MRSLDIPRSPADKPKYGFEGLENGGELYAFINQNNNNNNNTRSDPEYLEYLKTWHLEDSPKNYEEYLNILKEAESVSFQEIMDEYRGNKKETPEEIEAAKRIEDMLAEIKMMFEDANGIGSNPKTR